MKQFNSGLAEKFQSELDTPAKRMQDALKAASPSPLPLPDATIEPLFHRGLADHLRTPPLEETPHGRTMMAVEELADAAECVEGLMESVVRQVGTTADLVGGVTQTIREEAREFERKTAAQTKSAIGYAKWSLIVSALALAISAGAAILDRLDAADDSKETAGRAASHLSELTQMKQRLDEQIMLQKQSLDLARQDAERQAEIAAAQATRIEALEEKARQVVDVHPQTQRKKH